MFNQTGLFGTMMIGLTNTMTGDIYLTLFTLMFIVFLFFLALKIPLELTSILILPLIMVFMLDGGGDWTGFAGILVLYLALMFGKYFLK